MGTRSSQIFVNVNGGTGKGFGCQQDNRIKLTINVGSSAAYSKVLSNISIERWDNGKELGFDIVVDGQLYRSVNFDKKEKEFSKIKGKRINGSTRIQVKKEKASAMGMLNMVATVAKMGEIFADTDKEKNDWKKRMLKAGIGDAVQFPDDWDSLPEEEKKRRLDGSIDILSEKL